MRLLKLATSIFFISMMFLSFNLRGQELRITPIEKTDAIYYFDNTKYIPFCDSVLTDTRLKMIRLLQDTLSYKPSVYLLNNLDEFNKLVQGKFSDWGVGVAIPLKKMIVMKSPDSFNLNKPLGQLVAHEYAHLAVSDKVFMKIPPRWFNEGVAMYVSSEWGWSNNIAMGKAAVFGQFIDLQDIENVNRFHEGKAQVAYAESYMAISFLLKYYGQNSLKIFLEQINSKNSIDEAIYVTTGSTMDEFQDDFNRYLHKQFNIASLFMDTIFLWIALAGVVVYAFFLQFKKRREYYKKWEDEEKLQSTDFDYGDPNNPEQIDDDDEAWRQ